MNTDAPPKDWRKEPSKPKVKLKSIEEFIAGCNLIRGEIAALIECTLPSSTKVHLEKAYDHITALVTKPKMTMLDVAQPPKNVPPTNEEVNLPAPPDFLAKEEEEKKAEERVQEECQSNS